MNGLMDCVFPYLIQFLKEYTGKVDLLYTERKERQSAAVDEESAKKQQVHFFAFDFVQIRLALRVSACRLLFTGRWVSGVRHSG